MKKFVGIIAVVAFFALLASGIISHLVEFAIWLLMLQYSGPEISFAGEIVVRILTFGVSFGLVGIIFDAFGLYNGKIMSIAYYVISTIIGFILAYIIWTIEKYILVIGIILGIVAVLIVLFFVIKAIASKRKKDEEDE